MAISGVLFYTITQISHANESSSAQTDADMPDEWVLGQVRTARGDWSCDSSIWPFFSSGVNLQTVHHVFPSVHWAHYPYILRIVLEAAGEERPPRSFFDAVRDHITFIGKINSNEHSEHSEHDEHSEHS